MDRVYKASPFLVRNSQATVALLLVCCIVVKEIVQFFEEVCII